MNKARTETDEKSCGIKKNPQAFSGLIKLYLFHSSGEPYFKGSESPRRREMERVAASPGGFAYYRSVLLGLPPHSHGQFLSADLFQDLYT